MPIVYTDSSRNELELGQVYEVTFLDHVEGGDEPIEFVVYGRLVDARSRSLTIDSWAYADLMLPFDSNVVRYTIVRSSVTKLVRMEPA